MCADYPTEHLQEKLHHICLRAMEGKGGLGGVAGEIQFMSNQLPLQRYKNADESIFSRSQCNKITET
jgi:hypothetical protein